MSRWAGGCCRSICSEEGVPPERMKLSKGGGDPKSVNIECTYFLNGPLRKLLTKGTPFSMLNKTLAYMRPFSCAAEGAYPLIRDFNRDARLGCLWRGQCMQKGGRRGERVLCIWSISNFYA